MKKRGKSLKWSIMILCAIVVAVTAVSIGLNTVMSIRELSETSYSTYEKAMLDGYKLEIRSQVQSTLSIVQGEYDKFKAGEKTEEQAKKDAADIVRVMRYRDDESGYFWIDATDYTLVMHPIKTEDEGKNRKDMQDQNGVMITQQVVKVCQGKDKGGYNEFYFTKSDGKTVAPKLAYSQLFEPWGWVVCTGNYIDDMQSDMANVKESLNDTYVTLLIQVGIVFAATILFSLIIAFFFGSHLVKPLKKIQTFAEDLSKGDMTTQVSVKQRNEIGQVADSLSIAQQNIHSFLVDINTVSEKIGSALYNFSNMFGNMTQSIDEVSNAVNSIAGNVTDQAASTDEASGEVTIIADEIQRTNVELKALDKNTQDIKKLSESSMETLNHLIEVNTSARGNITSMRDQTEATDHSIQRIRMAVDLINEISDQTSLLALNASIEAARAGESGKGFAVVASEIGQLAQQSAQSVEEVRQVITELLGNAEKSVAVMQEMSESVDVQVNSLNDTQKIFMELYKEMDSCASSVQSIDAMAAEMEKQRSNVTQSLTMLNGLAQDNAAVTEETASMSLELSRVVEESGDDMNELKNSVEILLKNLRKFKM